MADGVEVFGVGGEYIDRVGPAVLPASIPSIDFSVLDRALKAEHDIADKSLNTIQSNLDRLGKIQDELTGIEAGNPYLKSQIDAAKKVHGIDDAAFSNALQGIHNPVAMYDLDRKMRSLASDPVIKDVMRKNAMIDMFRQSIPTIQDPYLRGMAMDRLMDVMEDSDNTNKPESLSISDYQPIDLSSAYMAVVDKIAPKTKGDRIVNDPSGARYVETTTARDPDLIRKAREIFITNPGVMNNLKARNIVDKNGNLVLSNGKSFFDLLEEGLAKSEKDISYYSAPPQTRTSEDGVIQGTMLFDRWTPNVHSGFDLALVSQAETGGRAPDNVVHIDPGNDAINIGAYSFNGGPEGGGKKYVQWLVNKYPENESLKELAALDMTKKDNFDKAKELYSAIEDQIPELEDLESTYAVEQYGTPIVKAAAKAGITDLTSAERTVLIDAAIQHGVGATSTWISDFAKNKKSESLIDYITKRRSKVAGGRYANRAQTVAQGALSIQDEATEPVDQEVDLSSWGLN